MKIKVFYPNEKGYIELTKEKLEGLLNEAYNEGYRDGRNNNGYYYGITNTPYVSSAHSPDITYSLTTTPSVSINTTEMLCDKAASSAIDCCGKVTSTTNDCIYTDAKISTIDCYVNTNDKVTALEGKANTNDRAIARESNPKNTIIVEYAEA